MLKCSAAEESGQECADKSEMLFGLTTNRKYKCPSCVQKDKNQMAGGNVNGNGGGDKGGQGGGKGNGGLAAGGSIAVQA